MNGGCSAKRWPSGPRHVALVAALSALLAATAASSARADPVAELAAPAPGRSPAPSPTQAAPPAGSATAGPTADAPAAATGLPAVPPSYGDNLGFGRPGFPTGDTGELHAGPLATRIRVLETNLNYLGNRGRNRVVDGVLSMVTGGLSIALGVIVDEQSLSEYLYLYGGAGVARGVLHLVLGSDPSDAALAFSPHADDQCRGGRRARALWGRRT